MPAGKGLLTLLVRVMSGRLLHDVGAYARREVRLIAVAVVGFVGFLTFLLGAAAIAVVMLYAMLVPRLGPFASYGVLIGVALAVAVVSLLIGMAAAKAFTRWEVTHEPRSAANLSKTRSVPRDEDASVALLISLVLEHLMSRPRRAPR